MKTDKSKSHVKHKQTFQTTQEMVQGVFKYSFKPMLATAQSKKNIAIEANLQNKELNISKQLYRQQRQSNIIIKSKIEQLHEKMKKYFTEQRKKHNDQISVQIQTLTKAIQQLRLQLSKPKSVGEIQTEKYQLLKKKNSILLNIEEINRQLKANKVVTAQVKLENEELDRELINSQTTINKYRRKLTEIQRSIINENNQTTNQNKQSKEMERQNQMMSIDQKMFLIKSKLNIKNFKKQSKLPLIKKTYLISGKQNNGNISLNESSVQCSIFATDISSPNYKYDMNDKQNSKENRQNWNINDSKKYQLQSSFKSNPLSILNILQKNVNTTKLKSKCKSNTTLQFQKLNHIYRDTLNNKQIQKIQQRNKQYKKIITENLTNKNHTSQNVKLLSTKFLNFEGSMVKQDLESKDKWKKIEDIFRQAATEDREEDCVEASSDLVKYQKNSLYGSKQSHHHHKQGSCYEHLGQLLMEELRKYQYEQYHEKGYHQGIKDKTHQIKLKLKNIFKNYSTRQFFDSIISKKTIKKELNNILLLGIQ